MGEVLKFGDFDHLRKAREAARSGESASNLNIQQDNVVRLPEESLKVSRPQEEKMTISDKAAYDIALDLIRLSSDRKKLYDIYLKENNKRTSPGNPEEFREEFEAVREAKMNNLREKWSDDQLKADLQVHKEDLKAHQENLKVLEGGIQVQKNEMRGFSTIHIVCVAQEYYLRKNEEFGPT